MGNISCTLKSVQGDTSLTLSDFHPEYQDAGADVFIVSVVSGSWRGEIRASTFMAADLGDFFRDLALSWKGWDGERHWSTLEGEFSLCATSDHLGHIRLAFVLTQPHTGLELQLKGALELEAGMLDSIANQVSAAWRQNAA
ncbi:DUF6228 family protein [[Pseudomonas] boreopolis]|uniref:DUF6228 family protein n=1 Tax=Xanthomonas boreopolis TaxID=86183 RepID=UPI003D54B995